MKKNCWEYQGCGFGPQESKNSEGQVCPAAVHEHADGFLGGENGGRSCYFIIGTICGGDGAQTPEEKKNRCNACSFYRDLSNKHGKTFTERNFLRYVINSENRIVY